MSSTNPTNRLQAKDLINVGIFTAIYFVVYFVVMMIAYIPILTLTLGFLVVSRVMRKFDLALAEIYFRGRVHAPWLPSSGQGAKGQGRRYAARLALDAL